MSKKVITITSVIFALLIVGLLITAYLILREGEKTPLEVLRGALPFGRPTEELVNIKPPIDVSIPTDELKFDDEGNPIVPLLRQLTSLPISGATSLTDEGGVVKVRYVDQASGNIHEVTAADVKRERLTNTTIPTIYEAIFNYNGQSLIFRYLDDEMNIKSFRATIIPGEDGVAKLDGSFLIDNIKEITTSPNNKKIFYLTEFEDRVIGITENFDGSGKEQIFEHSLKQWLVEWQQDNTFIFTTKPSVLVPGYSFLFTEKEGVLKRVVGGLLGLTTQYSSTLNNVIITYNDAAGLQTRLYKRGAETIEPFPLTVLPEKCLWSTEDTVIVYCGAPETFPQGDYPDGWYKGEFSFADNLWRINIETGEVSFLVSPQDFSGVEIDVINLFLSGNEDYLFFTNKKDGTLWGLRLFE